MGYSFDWYADTGMVVINKRGVQKAVLGIFEENMHNPARWQSRYGSITFTQTGRDFAGSGMNEAGLIICPLVLEEYTIYPRPDERPAIEALQWVQYQLDNFSTVSEVIASDANICIVPVPPGGLNVHFFVCDGSGSCAVIEFLNGRRVYHSGTALPVKAVTNAPCDELVTFLKTGVRPKFNKYQSAQRFARAAQLLKTLDSREETAPLDAALAILDKLSNGDVIIEDGVEIHTWAGGQWVLVFDSWKGTPSRRADR